MLGRMHRLRRKKGRGLTPGNTDILGQEKKDYKRDGMAGREVEGKLEREWCL